MRITEEAVRVRSYFIWEREGCPQGRDREHWLAAADELAREQRSALQVLRSETIMPRVAISRRPARLTSERIDARAA